MKWRCRLIAPPACNSRGLRRGAGGRGCANAPRSMRARRCGRSCSQRHEDRRELDPARPAITRKSSATSPPPRRAPPLERAGFACGIAGAARPDAPRGRANVAITSENGGKDRTLPVRREWRARDCAPCPAGRTGPVFHGFVPGLGAGALYGFRAHGPCARTRRRVFNPDRLLLDPQPWRSTVHPPTNPFLPPRRWTAAPSRPRRGDLRRNRRRRSGGKIPWPGHDPLRIACARLHPRARQRARGFARDVRRASPSAALAISSGSASPTLGAHALRRLDRRAPICMPRG